MQYKPTEYCKVCRHYDMYRNHCRKGWNNVFCNKDDFEPSWHTAVMNFIEIVSQEDTLPEWAIEEISNIAQKYGR